MSQNSTITLTPITFGTSGWRAILADEFTFENARFVVRAIADEVNANGDGEKGVVVSHDTRFLGETFALQAARVLAAAGVRPLLTDRDCPTPVVAWEIIRGKAAGGINFTASHNPAEYQGIKFSPANGGPASKELTKSLEHRIMELQIARQPIPMGDAPADRINPCSEYKKRIREIVDLESIRKSGFRILCNCMFGTSRGYLDALLTEAGCPIEVMNDKPDARFGGKPPEPAPAYVGDFLARLDEGGFNLGLATDGDADRFGVFAPVGSGKPVVAPNANEILAMLLDHLVESRGWKGTVVRTVATSHFVDAVAKLHGCSIVEVPVGFKWIAAEMAKDPTFVIGGEESGGLTIRGHVPEKDGILACLLVAEMVARRSKPLGEILADLKRRAGDIASNRINLHYKPEDRQKLLDRAAAKPAMLAGRNVVRKIEIDGSKFLLDDGSWIMARFSGTEPVVRIYVEGPPDRLPALEQAGRDLLNG
ncbi:MAG: phosphoglucomutase/phosphomannomutase family protein [Candidatus Hydrogenedentota bacterium]